MSSIANVATVRQPDVQVVSVPVLVFDPTCAWCIKAALTQGITLPVISESHGICQSHYEQMLVQLAGRKRGKTKMSRMPPVYREPRGGPLRWQDDVTGVLPKAVFAFLGDPSSGKRLITPAQLELVRDYCEYYLNAPCWRIEGVEAQFSALRERIKSITTVEELDTWLHDCLGVEIDPL